MAPLTSGSERTRAELLRLIRAGNGLTRADLVRSTGLSRSAVNAAVTALLRDTRVAELDAEQKGPGSGSGRPGARLVFASGPVAAIDFGHNHVHVAIADGLGAIVGDRRLELDVDVAADDAMDTAAAILSSLREEHGTPRLHAVVAGVPGPIDTRTGVVQSPTILSGWVGHSPSAELEARIGVPVRIENDAALGALGELHAGAGREHRNFLYVKASHGIGSGLVLRGELYRGGTGLAGEIGHTHLSGRTELCRCGNRGCLEAVVSVAAIRGLIAHTHPGADPDAIDVAAFDDQVTERLLHSSGQTLGEVLGDLCNLVNPTAVVVGGELGALAAFVAGVDHAIRSSAQPATSAALTVLPATLGTRAELQGALEMAARTAT